MEAVMNVTRSIAVSLALSVAALAPAVAVAKNGGASEVRAAGKCTKSSTAKLKAKPDGGRLETEFEVDQNRNGVAWKVTITRNGATVVNTTATTRAPSGSFSVERRISDAAGVDRISARATSPTGEVCTASLSI
jgi:hypothetical protein